MPDRRSTYSDLERDAAVRALDGVLYDDVNHDEIWRGRLVDAALGAIGMRRLSAAFRSMADAPHDRDIELRTPKHGNKRAVWWDSWADPSDAHPWAWREARADGTVGEPIPEADGWREVQ